MNIKDNIIRVPVDKIFPNPWNPNEQTAFIYERERRSIRKHGFLQPILVRQVKGGYQIIDGEHRWRAGQQEGYEELPVNNLGKVTDGIAKQLTLIMNETRGELRRDKLTEVLKSLSLDFSIEDLALDLPFQQTEIEQLLKSSEVDWDQVANPEDKKEEEGADDGLKTISIKAPEDVVERFKEQILRFKKVMFPESQNHDDMPAGAVLHGICHVLGQIPDSVILEVEPD